MFQLSRRSTCLDALVGLLVLTFGTFSTTAHAQAAKELTSEDIQRYMISRTFDVVFTRDTGEQIQAVITFGADGRFSGDNRFTPPLKDGTVTNSFDGKFKLRNNRICRQSRVVVVNGRAHRGQMSSERCWRVFLQNENFVFVSPASGNQSTWRPRN